MDIEELTLDIIENSKPMPPEFSQMVNDNFGIWWIKKGGLIMLDFTITFTGGGAIFAIGCIVYFIAGMLVEIGKWVEKKRKNKED